MQPELNGPWYRSGSAAQLAQVPVATLRVWERRYRVAASHASSSGQRLYSPADIERLTLIKQLTQSGHAIGSLAALSIDQLHEVASAQVRLPVATTLAPQPPTGLAAQPWQLAVVGAALAQRLATAPAARQLPRSVQIRATVATVNDWLLQPTPNVDALLIFMPSLHDDGLEKVAAALTASPQVTIGVVYGHASEAMCERFIRAGIALHRNSLSDMRLGVWLAGLQQLSAHRAAPPIALPARRWSDSQLADIASLPSQVACGCPGHIAELLQLLSSFEAYSAACESRHSADAQLHQYLSQTAGDARLAFENALLRLAALDGLNLPDTVQP